MLAIISMFNNFNCIFLRHYESRFPNIFTNHDHHKPKWTKKGIRISHRNKINLYNAYRNTNDPTEKDYYEKYCAVLRKGMTLQDYTILT
jgi:hypothetical protein